MKRNQKGPLKGISLKLQEVERERKMETAPNPLEFAENTLKLDYGTRRMLEELGLSALFEKKINN